MTRKLKYEHGLGWKAINEPANPTKKHRKFILETLSHALKKAIRELDDFDENITAPKFILAAVILGGAVYSSTLFLYLL